MTLAMQCPTTSGRYRCNRPFGHEGECEADDSPPLSAFGPYGDTLRSRAYLRGALDFAASATLDGIGGLLGVRRSDAEPDRVYRERIWNESRPT